MIVIAPSNASWAGDRARGALGNNPAASPEPGGIPTVLQKLQTLDQKVDTIQSEVSSDTPNAAYSLKQVVNGIGIDVTSIKDQAAVCSAPDLLVLPIPGVAGPRGFCQLSEEGKLQVRAYNQGSAETDTAGTLTRVVFTTSSGSVESPPLDTVDPNTSPLSAGGSQLLEFAIPSDCTGGAFGSCDFSIGVDALNTLGESDEGNNTVAGSCGAVILSGSWCCFYGACEVGSRGEVICHGCLRLARQFSNICQGTFLDCPGVHTEEGGAGGTITCYPVTSPGTGAQ